MCIINELVCTRSIWLDVLGYAYDDVLCEGETLCSSCPEQRDDQLLFHFTLYFKPAKSLR
jgi:hypothetical protein